VLAARGEAEMSEKDYDAIVKRVAWGLGPDWTVGEVGVNGPLSWLGPVYVQDRPGLDFVTLSWDIEDDYEVSQGRGDVLLLGEYPRASPMEQKTMDELTAFLRENVPGYHAPKKKLFGRG
jgi:hypothetical protein